MIHILIMLFVMKSKPLKVAAEKVCVLQGVLLYNNYVFAAVMLCNIV